ncbi:kynureninase [Flavilitoribacter nigricans]|uniref:Kynureninase n=1 Tax=Flavilitoribacter nigricans (strain ATCC 23147 / DSM 23189 / NBRC 102662 / NCIMB 1420 / SS-2) TaxID=1122177 RepID=A0A2D0N8V4_FLAN2|nr:kynureninase [Flavilitoribacter nigricans]PHN04905.1 kynureninase [Flavilitoribacter nigricans DSM 23189 = NBRC 102662]
MLKTDHQSSLAYARALDEKDQLAEFRSAYHIPAHGGNPAIYLCGNSLGLQPKATAGALEEELRQWQEKAVEGWFEGDRPWLSYHKYLQAPLSGVVGAETEEVIVMNTLTVNLHLLMVSFYRPTSRRYKIIMEAGAFPSDQYALASQVRFHGYDPQEAIVEVQPRAGEIHLRTEDILQTIDQNGAETALVLFGGVNYYTGQYFDLPAITEAAHRAGAYAGFDLAHAAGNVPMQLHDWKVDFAVWCSYKYLNSGPGGPSGAFIHARHGNDPDLPRFAGWWGQKEEERFLMQKTFHPIPGAAGWQISTVPIMSMAPHRISLELFDRAGMDRLHAKSELLTDYLSWQLDRLNRQEHRFQILTPSELSARGSQLSIYLEKEGKNLFDHLSRHGVICDWREDNLFHSGGGVIRVAPTAMYNTFEEIYQFTNLLEQYYTPKS